MKPYFPSFFIFANPSLKFSALSNKKGIEKIANVKNYSEFDMDFVQDNINNKINNQKVNNNLIF